MNEETARRVVRAPVTGATRYICNRSGGVESCFVLIDSPRRISRWIMRVAAVQPATPRSLFVNSVSRVNTTICVWPNA